MHNYGQSLGYGNVVVVVAAADVVVVDDADHLLFPDFLFEPAAAAAGVVDVLD